MNFMTFEPGDVKTWYFGLKSLIGANLLFYRRNIGLEASFSLMGQKIFRLSKI